MQEENKKLKDQGSWNWREEKAWNAWKIEMEWKKKSSQLQTPQGKDIATRQHSLGWCKRCGVKCYTYCKCLNMECPGNQQKCWKVKDGVWTKDGDDDKGEKGGQLQLDHGYEDKASGSGLNASEEAAEEKSALPAGQGRTPTVHEAKEGEPAAQENTLLAGGQAGVLKNDDANEEDPAVEKKTEKKKKDNKKDDDDNDTSHKDRRRKKRKSSSL